VFCMDFDILVKALSESAEDPSYRNCNVFWSRFSTLGLLKKLNRCSKSIIAPGKALIIYRTLVVTSNDIT